MNPAELIGGGIRLWVNTVKSLPGGPSAVAWLADAERELVRAVRQHLEDLEPTLAIANDPEPAETPEDLATPPEQLLRALMDRSMYNNPAESRTELHVALLAALVPDEARILAAVSDGAAYPVMHIGEPGVGAATNFALQNASTVGRAAGVSLPAKTPLYLTRMLRLELLDLGPEDTTMRDEYEMLLTDSAVHAAITTTGRGLRPARIIRRTVTISELGQEVWEAAK